MCAVAKWYQILINYSCKILSCVVFQSLRDYVKYQWLLAMAALVTMAYGTSWSHGISQVGWNPQGSLSPIPGCRQEPESKPCVWEWYPNSSWAPSAQGYEYCPGKPVSHPSPSCAEPFLNPQPYPALVQLHAIHLGPVIWGDRWGEVKYLELVSHDYDFVF